MTLLNFDVFLNDSPNKTELENDNKTTKSKFDFGSNLKILVKKIGHQDANVTSFLIEDKENILPLNLPKKQVS